jgi:CO/xanthine dehydrogenase Mo-binding subunit
MKLGAMRLVGKKIPRLDGYSKVCGEAIYGADFHLENALFLKVLRSPHHHGYIRDIDGSEALRVPGVLTIITWRDIPGENLSGKIKRDQPILAENKVRYVGEPVAVVVAETEEIAEKALEEINVDYELLDPVLSPEKALEPEAPTVHEGSNLLGEFNLSRGDMKEGFSKSDIIIENTYRTPFVEHAYIEPEAGAASIDSEGRICIYAASQYSHHIAREVCHMLSFPREKVRVIQTVMGGGFGGKTDISVHGVLALAAHKTKRAVKYIYTREESFLATAKRHPFIIYYRTGAQKDGRLMAVEADILMDTGAYASSGPAVVSRAGIHAVGPYEVPNVRVTCRGVYTNNPVAGAMRGFGVPEVVFAHESQMDIIASELVIDPYRIREKNILREGSRTITGQPLKTSVGMEETLRKAQEKLPRSRNSGEKSQKPYTKRGFGYGCVYYGIGNTGQVNHSEVKMAALNDGKVLISVGASELGQGLLTVFQQMGAEALGMPVEQVEVLTEDTSLTPDPGITSASKQTYVTGNAICRAAKKLIREISVQVAEHFQVSPEHVVYSGGNFIAIKNDRRMAIPVADAISRILSENSVDLMVTGSFTSETTPLDPVTGQGIPYPTYSYATQIAEVEVDVRTGKVRVVQIISANDVGKAINPETTEGQIVGGAVMGVGYAIMEHYLPGQTRNFGEYLIPTSCDVPRVIPIIVEDPESSGPFGAKGLGEVTCIPTAAAIANAVSNATGMRFYQLPLTPERVYEAFKRMDKG